MGYGCCSEEGKAQYRDNSPIDVGMLVNKGILLVVFEAVYPFVPALHAYCHSASVSNRKPFAVLSYAQELKLKPLLTKGMACLHRI